LDNERSTRIQRERDILQTLSDESNKLNELLEAEKSDRLDRMNQLSTSMNNQIQDQKNFMKRFEDKTTNDFAETRTDMDDEMDSRFKHQDEIVDDISKFINTFQNTLKVVSKND
jgi:DNA anti-recombination protein RmuC